MRIAIITPQALPRVTSRAVRADNVARGLRAAGHEVQVVDLASVEDGADAMTSVAMFDPDIVHVIDSFASGLMLGDPIPGHPLVLEMCAQDLHADIFDVEKTVVVQRVMNAARAIVLPSEAEAAYARALMPALAARFKVVPRGVTRGDGEFHLRRELKIPMSAFVFFLPGAITGLKNQGLAIQALDRVIEEHPNVHLVLAGEVKDPTYGPAILEAVRLRPYCHHIALIPHEGMGSAFADADVVLNTSLAEVGSTSLLEAMAAGRALIAAAIPGNLGLIEHNQTALTFTDAESLTQSAFTMIRDSSLRQRLGAAAFTRASSHHTPQIEATALLAIYSEWKGR